MHNPISLRQNLAFAWLTFKKRYRLFTAIILTMLGAWCVLEVTVIAGQQFGILWWAAAHLVFLVFFAGLVAGLCKICLHLCNQGEPTFADAFKYLTLGPVFLLGQIFYLLIVVVGLALFIIPGLYLGVRYALFGFCLVADQSDLVHSFRQSASLTKGVEINLLLILIILLLLNLIGASVLGVGLFITIPISCLILAAVYQQLPRRS